MDINTALRLLEDPNRHAEAEQALKGLAREKPDDLRPLIALSLLLGRQGRDGENIEVLENVVARAPNMAAAWSDLAISFKKTKRLNEALTAARRSVELDPSSAVAWTNLGLVLRESGAYGEAVDASRKAVEISPEKAGMWANLGNALAKAGNYGESEEALRRALSLDPDDHRNLVNLGNCLREQNRLQESLECFETAMMLAPDDPDVRWNRGLAILLSGDYANGFKEYEWRWAQDYMARREFSEPLWGGEPLAGKTLLLHAEQGLGDTLQFIRFIPEIRNAQAGGEVRIVLECQKPLLPLLEMAAKSLSLDAVVPAGGFLPPFDAHLPLLSLPGVLGTTLETIPARFPYLEADKELVRHWKARIGELSPDKESFNVGICWQGSIHNRFNDERSIPLDAFGPLAKVPGVRLFSLQKGNGTEQIAVCADSVPVVDLNSELDVEHGPFMDTAAVMDVLDLVITMDTSIAHLAGALGRPVWVVISNAPEWRWLVGRDDSPWYPSLRLFRQPRFGDWNSAFGEVAVVLEKTVSSKDARGEE